MTVVGEGVRGVGMKWAKCLRHENLDVTGVAGLSLTCWKWVPEARDSAFATW